MFILVTLLTALIACLGLLVWLGGYGYGEANGRRKNRGITAPDLPGPTGLPFIGCLHKITKPSWVYFQGLTKTYGPVFQIQLGLKNVVVLNTYPVLKKAFVENAENFSDRWHSRFHHALTLNSGLTLFDYDQMKEHKNFLHKSLKDFGFARSRSEEIARHELRFMLDWLEERDAAPIVPTTLCRKIFNNVISSLAFNTRFGADDEDFEAQIAAICKFLENENLIKNPINLYPFLNYIFFAMTQIPHFKESLRGWNQVHTYIDRKIAEHRAGMRERRLDAGQTEAADNFLDLYLTELDRITAEAAATGRPAMFNHMDVHEVLLELFFAGTDTSAATLAWGMYLMASFPAVQQRVYDEINEQIGVEKPPVLAEKSTLHYTQAVIDEIFRFSSLGALGICHRCKQDTVLDGYYVPGDSLVISNTYAIHRDPDVWKRPEEFWPEHFLTEDDAQHYRKRVELVPFSIGKRVCLGKTLAQMDFYIFFVGMVQKYRISYAGEQRSPYEIANPKFDGLLRNPLEFPLNFERRQ